MMQVDWELSQSFTSDGQGVRAISVAPAASSGDGSNTSQADAGRILTGNQVGGVYAFGVPSGNLYPLSYQHNHAVTALVVLNSAATTPALSCFATGCKDSKIRIFHSDSYELQRSLEGHTKPVTSLAAWGRFLVSGSWDGSAAVWDWTTGRKIAQLEGHENSVCVDIVAGESNDETQLVLVTGSAGMAEGNVIRNHAIRKWSVNVQNSATSLLYHVANDHEGPIRDVCVVGETTVATCSNDGTVKLRSLATGQSEATLIFVTAQHPPMLLSVCHVPAAQALVASAEDGHVVVWDLQQQAEQPQILRHASCVWRVLPLDDETGDFCTAADDGVVRIFTRSTERYASEDERTAFQEEAAKAAKQQESGQGPSAEEIAKLPHWEAQRHDISGTSEGQIHLFQKDGVAIAAQWSASSQTWIEVGQVMGSRDSGTIDGVSYDHVLPIEVDQPAASGGGVAKLQIGYNNGENPFVAAQRFIDAHMLPQYHLNEIANYIEQRVGSGGRTLGGPASSGAAVGPAATTGVPIGAYQHLPISKYHVFDLPAAKAQTTLEKMKTKIMEFGLVQENETTEVSNLESLMKVLGDPKSYSTSTVSDEALGTIVLMLGRASPSQSFPALDLARMAVLHQHATAMERADIWRKIVSKAVALTQDTGSLEGPAATFVPMLTLRLLANALQAAPTSAVHEVVVSNHLGDALSCMEGQVNASNKNVRLSVATLASNLAYFLQQNATAAIVPLLPRLMPLFSNVLSNKAYEETAVMRTLQALGTLVLVSSEAKTAAKSLYMASKVEPAASPHGPDTKKAAKEVYHALQ